MGGALVVRRANALAPIGEQHFAAPSGDRIANCDRFVKRNLLNRVVAKVAELSPSLQCAALEAALPCAQGKDAAFLVGVALDLAQRHREVGWLGTLDRVWTQVTAGQDLVEVQSIARKMLVCWGWKGERELFPAIAKVVGDEWQRNIELKADALAVEGTLRLAEVSLRGECAHALLELMLHGESATAIRAGKAMLRAASSGDADDAGQRALRDAIASACERFDEHRMGVVMVAAIHALTPAVRRRIEREPLMDWFERNARDPHPALLAALRGKQDHTVEIRCWEWMRFAPLAEACGVRWKQAICEMEGIHRSTMMAPSSLAAHPCRQRGMMWTGEEVCQLISQGGDSGWSTSCLADRSHPGVATTILQTQDARQLLRLAVDGDSMACVDLAFAAPGPIAEFATHRFSWMHAHDISSTLLWEKLGRSPLPAVRAVVAQTSAARGAIDLACAVRGVEDACWFDSASIGMRASRMEGTGDWNRLTSTIKSGESQEVVRLVRLLKRTANIDLVADGILDRLEVELQNATSEVSSGYLAATLVHAIGACAAQERVRELVMKAIEHPNPRVRSNAIEAASDWNRRNRNGQVIDIWAHTADAAHRPRATAVRQLARFECEVKREQGSDDRVFLPRVGDLLSSMLSDDRPYHRLSGTWAAERVLVGLGPNLAAERWSELCDRLVEISDRDVEPAVRRRARAATQRLRAEIRLRSRRDLTDLAAALPTDVVQEVN